MIINGIKLVFSLCLLVAVSPSVLASSIADGVFANGLNNWSVFYSDQGNVTASGGQAVLTTGDSSFAAIPAALGQGLVYDSFGNPLLANPFNLTSNDLTLNFTAVFQNVGPNPNETGTGPGSDLLNVVAYDATNAYILTTIDATTTQNNFTLDLSSLWNNSVGFSFELNNNNDGNASQVTLSNIAIAEQQIATVPLPNPLLLFSLGLSILAVCSKRIKKLDL
jgi:hypothetical protein